MPFCRADPPLGARVNVVGTVNVFEAVRRRVDAGDAMAPVVYTGSIGMFSASDVDAETGQLREDAEPHPANHYGVYKFANEGTARVYWADSGVPSVGLRPMTVYGAGRDQGMTSSPTVAIAAAVLGLPFRITFGGSTLFQYAEDVARTLLMASRAAPAGPRVFNLGGSPVAIEAWIDAIEEVVPDARRLLTFEPAPLPFPADIEHARLAELGDVPVTPYRDAIAATARIFQDLAEGGTPPRHRTGDPGGAAVARWVRHRLIIDSCPSTPMSTASPSRPISSRPGRRGSSRTSSDCTRSEPGTGPAAVASVDAPRVLLRLGRRRRHGHRRADHGRRPLGARGVPVDDDRRTGLVDRVRLLRRRRRTDRVRLPGPLSGSLMGRIGVKNVVLLSLVLTGGSLIAASFGREIWQLTLLFGLLGLGTGLVASVLGPTVATRWFVKDRGLVVGLFGASNSAGQLIFFPLLTALAVTVGWRAGAVVLGVIVARLVIPAIIWLQDDPADVGARPRGATEGAIVHVRPPDRA